MASIRPQESIRRGAVCLNNAAVTLLERGCYRQSYGTLKAAVSIMRSDVNKETCQRLERELKASVKHLNAPPCASSNRVPLRVLSDEGTHFHTALRLDDCVFTMCPLRIEECDSFDGSEWDVIAAIVVYNFAVSQLCVARTVKRQSAHQKLTAFALKILEVARTMLFLGEKEDSTKVLFVGIVVLHTMAQAAYNLGMFHQAKESADKLAHLQSSVALLDDVESRGHSNFAAAA